MTRYRPLVWPDDHTALAQLDVSFTSDVIYTVVAAPLGFLLAEQAVDPPIVKRYEVAWDALVRANGAVVAERAGRILGVAAVRFHEWNRRAELSHLFVDRAARRSSVGAGLVLEVRRQAEALGARSLWVETQNVNAPAIRFYQRLGFACCGLDTELYDPRLVRGETAVFFNLPLESSGD